MGLSPFTLTLAALLLAGNVVCDNSTACAAVWGEVGPWSAALEDWVTAADSTHSDRHGRIMALPASPGYYVTDRVDRPPSPPPGPRPYSEWQQGPIQGHPQGPMQGHPQGSTQGSMQGLMQGSMQGPTLYREPAGSKIVNRPGYQGDKFKPSPAYNPQAPYQQNAPSKPPHSKPVVDRVDNPPKRPVTDTDLYLLSAIEKLVYRADLMEKRLRRLEESVHRIIVNKEPMPEPCVANFTRVGRHCYHLSGEAMDWKEANLHCRRLRADLVELHTDKDKNTLIATLLTDQRIRGMDIWTGGLNPGLLWIWAHSARPVVPNGTNATVAGEGRCLALIHDPALNNYQYRGQDCAFRHRFVCEKEEDKTRLTNEIERDSKLVTHIKEIPLERESQLVTQQTELVTQQTREIERDSQLVTEQVMEMKEIANEVAANVSARNHKAMRMEA